MIKSALVLFVAYIVFVVTAADLPFRVTDCDTPCAGGLCMYEGCKSPVSCGGGLCKFINCVNPTCPGIHFNNLHLTIVK
jgi:hypothetical protein